MINMTGKIYIIGIGPGSSEYLTKKAIDTVEMSDYTVGSTRAIELSMMCKTQSHSMSKNCWIH